MDAKDLIWAALAEDIGNGDVTSLSIIPADDDSEAVIVSKQDGVVCGVDIAIDAFRLYDDSVQVKRSKKDGDRIVAGDEIMRIRGRTRSILSCERTALNFLQLLSGTATAASAYSAKLKKARLLDTRKTIPCMRDLLKYAVRTGGGKNHRIGLYDMVLIKDNHIEAADSITKAVAAVRKSPVFTKKMKIEVEVETLDQLKEALGLDVDMIMLDNMDIATMKEAVAVRDASGKKILLEASGNVDLDNIAEVDSTGVDFISVGRALTLSIKAVDFSLRIV